MRGSHRSVRTARATASAAEPAGRVAAAATSGARRGSARTAGDSDARDMPGNGSFERCRVVGGRVGEGWTLSDPDTARSPPGAGPRRTGGAGGASSRVQLNQADSIPSNPTDLVEMGR